MINEMDYKCSEDMWPILHKFCSQVLPPTSPQYSSTTSMMNKRMQKVASKNIDKLADELEHEDLHVALGDSIQRFRRIIKHARLQPPPEDSE